ncbi:MAG: sigma-54-dependent Fis family transcriptional regulator [Burkholderiaceae bacterium]|nr:sigma-54-dependent Fis family transcriptional regulator [Burkholderiaceae bacterium]
MNQSDPTFRAAARGARIPRVLVVDDEADLRELLELTLVGMGLDVDCAADVRGAQRMLGEQRYALCLTDMRLPDGEGLELVDLISRQYPATPVAVITAYGSAENAVAALKAGAFDYLAKPVALDALRSLVRSAIQINEPESGPRRAADGAKGDPTARLLGESQAIRDVRAQISRLARSMAPVAITGESGSGKELAARLVHEAGPRGGEPFVAVNCGAIPENLMEAEFFGYRKGAFTGAEQDRDGFFQAANGGTLFLDEVADLPLAMQVKLLRAIQEKRVRKVGATAEDPVDVRIISATHQNLAQCVAAGRFRQDLFYRLNVIELRLPPLRERREDVPVLAEAVLARLARRARMSEPPKLASVTLRYLQSYGFPGNVRELENILERALAFSNGEVVNVEDLGLKPEATQDAVNERMPDEERMSVVDDDPPVAMAGSGVRMSPEGIPESLPDYLDQVEREAIERALEKTRYNRTAAARLLGISFRALRYRMQRLEIN